MSEPLDILCPKCGADPGLPCVGPRGSARRSFHRERGRRRVQHPVLAADLETESPLEKVLADHIASWIDHHEADARISTQVPLGQYRLDMMIETTGDRLAVEVDGADFHNSMEQIERDKRRDRYCALQGIAVMRFTGREVFGDPRGCAAEVGLWIRRRR